MGFLQLEEVKLLSILLWVCSASILKLSVTEMEGSATCLRLLNGLEEPGVWELQESALLKLAGKQAAREEEMGRMRDRARLLEAEVADLQQEVDLRQQQEVALKEVHGCEGLLICLET